MGNKSSKQGPTKTKSTKCAPAHQVLSDSYLLQQIFSFLSPTDLILQAQLICKTAHTSIHSENEFLRESIKRAVGQWSSSAEPSSSAQSQDGLPRQESEFMREKQLKEAMTALFKTTKYPQPVQCLGFRSTLSEQITSPIVNIGFWEQNGGYESAAPTPGVVSMIPLTR